MNLSLSSFNMSGNDGTNSELFPGWSSVVHQPAEDPEESDLPSTVDITAFTSGLSVELNNTGQNEENSDSESDSEPDSSNSGTDASQSCSQSDSSDSDSSTSSQSSHSGHSSPSHEFSVTSSQTNVLRLTIATKRKQSPVEEKDSGKSSCGQTAKRSDSPSSGSAASSDSDSASADSEPALSNAKRNTNHARRTAAAASKPDSPVKVGSRPAVKTGDRRMVMRSRAKVAEKKDERAAKKEVVVGAAGAKGGGVKTRQRQRRTRKMASLPLSRGSTYSSSDSDDSDAEGMLASCSLQEIRQEDLAAILPDQQEIDAFDFECDRSDKRSPAAGDLSCSDMELPQQAVNALIQRTTESSSEGEGHAPPNPSSLYANSLLQQFVAQTQMLNAPCPVAVDVLKPAVPQEVQNVKAEGESVKRRRGRPKKESKSVEYCANPNVSPDSGIQNSPLHVSSPEPTKEEAKKPEKKPAKPTGKPVAKPKEISKMPVTATRFDRALYGAGDRVLYPRRRVGRPPVGKKGPGRPPKGKQEPEKQQPKGRSPKIKPAVAGAKGKSKYQTLKVPKLMHSKHKKHKKYKFKVLKPMAAREPKPHIEIDALVADFTKCCVIATQKPKEPPAEKTVKKVTKKRKTTEYSEKKKKKQNVAVADNKVNNSNEQRLPLKKRHYHLVNSTETKLEDDEIKQEPEEKIKVKQSSSKVQNINNNDYDTEESKKAVESHVAEAIEACVNHLSEEEKPPKVEVDDKPTPNGSMTTPKKRHRLELPHSAEVKAEPVEEKPKPKISIEGFITELKVKRNLVPKSPAREDKKAAEKSKELPAGEQGDAKLSPESAKKKVRKRRAINRTGFPTVKKKKKKPSSPVEPAVPNLVESQGSNSCDRVPKEGEQYSEFVQRMEKPESTPANPEKSPSDDGSSKWEFMSECESLPQEERTDFDDDMKPDRMTLRRRDLSPTTSIETRSTRSKHDDLDVDLDVSLESSIERLRSRLEERKKRKRNDKADSNGYPKRKLREASPVGSAEPLFERRLKEERASASGDEKRGKKAPRKKYLVAGLFSDYYKEDDEATRQKRAENANKPSRLAYNPSEHPYGLLPAPYHCGKYLRCRRMSFQLPYDIWWQHTHSQLPGRDVVPSWNYRKVRTNVYNTKTTTGACEPQSCNCKPSSDCGDDCINRLVLSECPASHKCGNQRIQRHEWSPGLEKFMTDSKGWGVRTKLPIKTGDFILEYVGEVVSEREFKERMATIYANDTHHYCLHLDGGLFIDGHRTGGDGRFVNHSCAPNCEMQKWSVNGQFRMAMFALRDISADEELTYDYNFTLFNAAEGQECKCGSDLCRGVIGGKSQRVRQLPEAPPTVKNPGRVGRPRKTEAKKKTDGGEKVPLVAQIVPPPAIQVKPMSHQQKCFVAERRCFLLRNLAKVRKARDRSLSATSAAPGQRTATPTDTSAFVNRLNALQKPRNMKTRRLAQVEDDPELNKTVKLAALLKEIWSAVVDAKDENGDSLSTPFLTMPSKRKTPEFYTRLTNPLDLTTIEQNIATGMYKTAASFDEDFHGMFRNYARFYGRTSDVGVAAVKLEKVYAESKKKSLEKFEDAVGEKPPPAFVSSKKKSEEEEDIIRCICGIPRDEGLMIQCERCFVWQHCECVNADVSASSYHCEMCVPRKVDYEIPMDEYTEHNHRYYMTLMRGDLQLRQGDTVYVLRDIPIEGTDRKHTYDTIGKIDYAELDIFRIERLWKEEKTGKRLAYGHHYLRPHETFHEPTRKFFPNEVMRVPLYEAVPVELIISRCWVLDINTFCKGRPIGAAEEHVYICEYRVDKAAKMFSKVSRSKYPVCTKSFAFEKFEQRLKVSRTYCPHDVDEALMKGGGGGRKTKDEGKRTATGSGSKQKEAAATVAVLPQVVKTPAEQRSRLNRILLNLLGKMPTKQALDVSYLLEGGRRRKKATENVNK